MTDVLALLLVAPPGAGKGTQAQRLADHYGIAHLSSGEMLRRHMADDTRIGRIAGRYLARGDLVPDELVLEMLTTPILTAAQQGGFVLDGFPRNIRQAKLAERDRRFRGLMLRAVIHLAVDRQELHRRLLARAQSEGRSDDTERVIGRRFAVYDAETRPLLGFYAKRGLLVDINGQRPVDVVFTDIVAAVDARHDSSAGRN